MLEIINRNQLQLVYCSAPESFTWSNVNHRTYIDYFLVKNIEYSGFRIIDSIGSSDHQALELQIDNLSALVVRKVMR